MAEEKDPQDSEDTEGQSVRHVIEEGDAEGTSANDTEGESFKIKLGETEDDTEGEGFRLKVGETEDDTEGEGFRMR